MTQLPELKKSGTRENREPSCDAAPACIKNTANCRFSPENQADAEIRRWARIPALRLRLKTQTASRTGLRERPT